MICGLIPKSGGAITLYGKDHTDGDVRAKVGVLIESPGCFPALTVWENMMLQAANLRISSPEEAVIRVLKTVRMEGAAGNKYKNCSLGMKQRVGIAMALLGDPTLLVLDEPLNGLDADGMRIMREVFTDIIRGGERSIVVSSHLLGELQKVATHYGIIRHGKMIREMTAAELDESCRTYVAIQTGEMNRTKMLLGCKYSRVEEDEAGYIRVYDLTTPEEIVVYLYENGIPVTEIRTDKIGLEEYYMDLMKEGK
jgi:ABC-2 type transport system ATP-binding protein